MARDSVYSLRFNPDDLALLHRLVAQKGSTVAKVVRDALHLLAVRDDQPTVQVTGAQGLSVWITGSRAPTATTGGLTLNAPYMVTTASN